MSEVINQDFIGVVIRVDDKLSYAEYPTNFNYHFADKLSRMVKNDCYSFMDMQRLFYANFYDSGVEYEYATSESYTDSFVDKIHFPYKYTEQDYKDFLLVEKKQIRKKNKGKTDVEITSIAEYNLKSRLFSNYQRYMYAKAYSETLKDIKKDESIKMFSTENVGWNHQFHLQLTDDIDIIVHTNFCYGSKSYMDFSLRYKGVLIVPYSDYITFFYARVESFLRCTRRYIPSRLNWKPLLEYVVALSNRTLEDPNSFIETWLLNEIRKMTDGLEDMFNNPKNYLGNLSSSNDSVVRIVKIDGGRGFKYAEIDEEDRELNFVAEKVSGALLFMEELHTSSLLQGDIKQYFLKILRLNESLLPNVSKRLNDYKQYIVELTKTVNELSKKTERLNKEKEKEEQNLERYINWYKKQVDYKIKEFKTTSDITKEYRENHPGLSRSEQKYNDAYSEYAIADGKLKRRIAFAQELEVFISRYNTARNIFV